MAIPYVAQTWVENDVFTPDQATDISVSLAEVTANGGVAETNLADDAVSSRTVAPTCIQTGIASNTRTWTTGQTITVPVVFTTPFLAVPKVVCGIHGTGSPSGWSVGVSAITVDGFNVYITRLGSGGVMTGYGSWIAVAV